MNTNAMNAASLVTEHTSVDVNNLVVRVEIHLGLPTVDHRQAARNTTSSEQSHRRY